MREARTAAITVTVIITVNENVIYYHQFTL